MSRKIAFVILLIFLTSCQKESPKTEQPKDSPFEQTSRTYIEIDQTIANHAKELVQQHDEVVQVESINSLHALVVGFNVSNMNRLRMKNIRKQIEKELKQAYPTIDIAVSTDKKILIELEKVNKRLDEKSISTNDLQRRVREIITLSRDET